MIDKLSSAWYTHIMLREVRKIKGLTINPRKVLVSPKSQDKFSLTIDTFYYIYFFRKVNENPKTK